ncbi:hypothetical protein EYC58_02355 [Candidatus Saccharibacteria bacterium]|nr:MAG: hypothetical protein EYC58_02355 [Candidatus Saccharibacteria bacterium]
MKASRIILSGVVMIVATIVAPLSVFAASYGGGSVQGYAADTVLDNGTIVQLTGKDSNRVKVAAQSDLQNMFGVTVDRNQLPLTISNGDLQNETYVAVSGTYNVLVSSQGGDITSGDYVTLSSLNGIAMKAGTEEKTVFGRAAASFDGKGVTLGKTEIKDKSGKTYKTVTLGSIPVTIDIKRNPNTKSTKVNVPEVLQRIGEVVAEKEVSPIRIYLSMGITAISLIAAIIVIYSGVRNGLISIGRNPMSKKTIFRALVEIILTSLLILIIGLFAVYLLLKL